MLNKIYNYIKYDGKPPKEVLEKLKVKKTKKRGFNWRGFRGLNMFIAPQIGGYMDKRNSSNDTVPCGTLPKGFFSKSEPPQIPTPKPVKSEEQLLQESLDRQEKLLDNELEYMDKMYGECEVCHNDILDIHSKCTALTCGSHGTVIDSTSNARISGIT